MFLQTFLDIQQTKRPLGGPKSRSKGIEIAQDPTTGFWVTQHIKEPFQPPAPPKKRSNKKKKYEPSVSSEDSSSSYASSYSSASIVSSAPSVRTKKEPPNFLQSFSKISEENSAEKIEDKKNVGWSKNQEERVIVEEEEVEEDEEEEEDAATILRRTDQYPYPPSRDEGPISAAFVDEQEGYDLLLVHVLQKSSSEWACVELHASCPPPTKLVPQQQATQQSISYFDEDLLAEKLSFQTPNLPISYRVLIHQSPNKYTARYFQSLRQAKRVYAYLYTRFVNRSYSPIHVLTQKVGSLKAQATGRSTQVSTLSAPLAQFVAKIYSVATTGLARAVSGNVSTHGIESALGALSLPQIEKAEALLQELWRLKDKVDNKDSEFVRILAQLSAALPLRSPLVLDELYEFHWVQELLQLMKDLVSVNESKGAMSLASSPIDLQYKALGCHVTPLAPNVAEYKTVETHVVESQVKAKDTNIRVLNIYKVDRGAEGRSSVGNNKLLFHGSSVGNIVGLLMRGLLLPKIVVQQRGERWDYGTLGDGIYFGDAASTAVQYALSSIAGTRMMLICDVALGRIKEFSTPRAERGCPAGYDSVLGLGMAAGRVTDFEDNEYVVFDTAQVKVKYVVEFTAFGENVVVASTVPVPQTPVVVTPVIDVNAGTDENVDVSVDNLTIDEEEVLKPERTGLVVSQNGQDVSVPLRAVYVRGKLLDLVGEVIVMQEYKNDSSAPLEARYVFPLDDKCAVVAFEAYIDGKHVIGVCKEKEQARREYKKAIEEGHGAYLMEAEKADVFSVSVGNLPPGASVLIKITYVCELTMVGDDIRFSLPASVAPSQALEDGLNRNLQRTTATVASTKAAGLDLQLFLDMPYDIVELQSLNQDISVRRTKAKATIELTGCVLTHDFVLLIRLEKPREPRMWVEKDDKDHRACMLVFYPDFAQPVLGCEIIFVLDRSSSMEGAALDDARTTLTRAIANLPPGCLFNVIGFGSSYDSLFIDSEEATPSNVKKALKLVQKSRANMGGTELWKPLCALYALDEKSKERTRNIFLITDGQLPEENQIGSLAAAHAASTRLFVLGVGPSVSRHTIQCLATRGGGAGEVIHGSYTEHRVKNDKVVTMQIKRAMQPVMRDVSIEWLQTSSRDAANNKQAPNVISSLFQGERLIVYGFVDFCQSAILTAHGTKGSSIRTRVDCPAANVSDGNIIHRLTARAMVRDYESGTFDADRVNHNIIKNNKKAEMVALSLQYSIVTEFTSFVAIEKRDASLHKERTPSLEEIVYKHTVDEICYIRPTIIPAAKGQIEPETASVAQLEQHQVKNQLLSAESDSSSTEDDESASDTAATEKDMDQKHDDVSSDASEEERAPSLSVRRRSLSLEHRSRASSPSDLSRSPPRRPRRRMTRSPSLEQRRRASSPSDLSRSPPRRRMRRSPSRKRNSVSECDNRLSDLSRSRSRSPSLASSPTKLMLMIDARRSSPVLVAQQAVVSKSQSASSIVMKERADDSDDELYSRAKMKRKSKFTGITDAKLALDSSKSLMTERAESEDRSRNRPTDHAAGEDEVDGRVREERDFGFPSRGFVRGAGRERGRGRGGARGGGFGGRRGDFESVQEQAPREVNAPQQQRSEFRDLQETSFSFAAPTPIPLEGVVNRSLGGAPPPPPPSATSPVQFGEPSPFRSFNNVIHSRMATVKDAAQKEAEKLHLLSARRTRIRGDLSPDPTPAPSSFSTSSSSSSATPLMSDPLSCSMFSSSSSAPRSGGAGGMMRLFGAKKASAPTKDHPAMKTLESTRRLLEVRETQLQSRISHSLESAKAAAKSGDKQSALVQLRRKKMYERQAETLQGQSAHLEAQLMALEQSAMSESIMQSMHQGTNALLSHINTNDGESGGWDQLGEVVDAMTLPLGAGEDELEDELVLSLEMDAEAFSETLKRDQDKRQRAQDRAYQAQLAEDEELAELEASMGLGDETPAQFGGHTHHSAPKPSQRAPRPPPPRPAAEEVPNKIKFLAKYQNADGSFKLTNIFEEILGLKPGTIESMLGMTGLLVFGDEQFNAAKLALVCAFAVAFLIEHQQLFDGMQAKSLIELGTMYLHEFAAAFPQAAITAGLGDDPTFVKYCRLYLIEHSQDAGFRNGRIWRQPGALLCTRCQVSVLALGANNHNPLYNGGASCDDCRVSMRTTTAFSCYPCTSDVCGACYEKRVGQVRVKCTRCLTHDLTLGANAANPVYGGRASCDDCGVSLLATEAYSCPPCTTDLCLFCYRVRRQKMSPHTAGSNVPRVALSAEEEELQQQQERLAKLQLQQEELRRQQDVQNTVQFLQLQEEATKQNALKERLLREEQQRLRRAESEQKRALFMQQQEQSLHHQVDQQIQTLPNKKQQQEALFRERKRLQQEQEIEKTHLDQVQQQLQLLPLLQLQKQQQSFEQNRSHQEQLKEQATATEVSRQLQQLPTQQLQQQQQRQTQLKLQLQQQMQQEKIKLQQEKELEQEKLQQRLLQQEYEKQRRITEMLARERESQLKHTLEVQQEILAQSTPPPSPRPSPTYSSLPPPSSPRPFNISSAPSSPRPLAPPAVEEDNDDEAQFAEAMRLSMLENYSPVHSPAASRNASPRPSPQLAPASPSRPTPSSPSIASRLPVTSPLPSPRVASPLPSPRIFSPLPSPAIKPVLSPAPSPRSLPSSPARPALPASRRLPTSAVPTLSLPSVSVSAPAPVATATPSGGCSELYCSCKGFVPQKWDANKCNGCMHWKAKHAAETVAAPPPPPPVATAAPSGGCSELYCSCQGFVPQKWDANKCNGCMHWKAKHAAAASGSPTPPALDCPKKHGLKDFTTPGPSFTCDICKQTQNAGAKMHSCRVCDFDACPACFSKR